MAKMDEGPDFDRLGEEGYRKLAAEMGCLERKPAPSLSPYRLSEEYEQRRSEETLSSLLGVGTPRVNWN